MAKKSQKTATTTTKTQVLRKTLRLAELESNRLLLSHPDIGDVAYRIEGTLSVDAPADVDLLAKDACAEGPVALTPVDMSIVARPICPVPAPFPKLISFSFAMDDEAMTDASGSFDPVRGVAALRVPVAVVIPDFEYRSDAIPTEGADDPAGDYPFEDRQVGVAHFALHCGDGVFKMSGFADAIRLPGSVYLDGDPVFGGCFEIADGMRCGLIKVTLRNATGDPKFTEKMANDVLKRVNDIFSCKTGQACINFQSTKFYATSLVAPNPRLRPKADPESTRDYLKWLAPYRNDISTNKGEVFNVHFIDRFNTSRTNTPNDGLLGALVPLGGNASCAVSTRNNAGKKYTTDELAGLLANTISRRLALAVFQTKADPKGVRGPSPNKTNLSFRPQNIAGYGANLIANTQLNAAQCKQLRRSLYITATKDTCTFKPREKIA